MAPAPFLVPCLATLRAEFNLIAPRRDKGADGWIGDPAHAARTSDHNPDPRGRVLALDIDSTGPWPGGPAWFNQVVESLRGDGRLEYIIWNRRIASRDRADWAWRDYNGSPDPHTNHAHFSARHDHSWNTATNPWGLLEDDMALTEDLIPITASMATRMGGGKKEGDKVSAATLLQLAAIWAKDGTAPAATGAVDLDQLADKVVDRLAARLQG